MAVTTGSYTTASGGYTPTDLAAAKRDALIDSGIMTGGWHDTGTSGGLEFRVLELPYDATKTYGKTYYIYLFSGADIFCSVASGWNGTSNIPAGPIGAGTQYVDWFSTTLSTANSLRLTASTTAGFNNAQSAPIKRWTSTDRPNFSVIQITNGTVNVPIIIERTAPNSTLVDLNKEIYTSMMWPRLSVAGNTATGCFQLFPMKLRGSHQGAGLRGFTDAGSYGLSATAVNPWDPASGFFHANSGAGIFYGAPGNVSGAGGNLAYSTPVFQLPAKFSNTNSNFITDDRAPYSGLLLNLYSSATLPADFALMPVYNANTISPGETITITPGVEVWTVISVANAATLGNPTMAFVARTT